MNGLTALGWVKNEHAISGVQFVQLTEGGRAQEQRIRQTYPTNLSFRQPG
jgi:hypothetical protein